MFARRPSPSCGVIGVLESSAVPAVSAAPVSVTLTYDGGGLLSHLAVPMRVKRHLALLHYP